VPARRVASTTQATLQAARQYLAESAEATHPAVRYSHAHLAALRAAAAVLAARETAEQPRRGKPRTAWERLSAAEPLFRDWASFFAAGATKRAAAEAGLPNAVTPIEADELLHDAGVFVTLVEDTLGVSTQQALPITSPLAG
ncbi:MAG: SAV_6107 family HEPN domain-containing protein, partial [Streptosporangiaceae bacterium]